jgi:zinc protease
MSFTRRPSSLRCPRLWPAVLACWLAVPALAQVSEHRLANGLRILVQQDRRAPVVACMLWYRAGSVDEATGATGVAHVLEHMMFKGTEQVPAGQFARTIARAGGRSNAFTNRDATAYHQQLHRSQLSLALQLEADRMTNLVLDAAEFAREVRVVMEERRLRTEDQPRALLHEALMATAYQAHPYRTPVIGWMHDLRNMTVEDARAWYRAYYAPNNATLVVVGDVEPSEVLAEAQRWFGSIQPRMPPQGKAHEEPVQRGMRRVEISAPADLAQVLLAWHVPVLRDVEGNADPYALWVLSAVLGGSGAARLPRDIVRLRQLAVSASAAYDGINRGPGLFVLSAIASPGHAIEVVETALREEVLRIARQGITREELERTRVQAVAAQVFQRDSVLGQAMQIGALAGAGLPPDSTEAQVRKLQEVTAEQVQAVALKYFADANLTVAVLRPQPLPSAARPAPAPSSGDQ